MEAEAIGKRNEEGFFNALKEVAKKIKELDEIVVIHHYDADGLTSGGIVIKALGREGKKVSHLCLKQLYKENIEEIKALGKNYLFVDFGSGQLDYLKKDLGEENCFILDHHLPVKIKEEIPNMRYHINPLLYGIDGGKELSGSGTTFFFALALNKKNSDLVPLAIVGAVGDMQDFSGKLIGLNRKLLEIAEKEKLVSVKNDLRLYGRISRPLTSFLMFSSSPILPELTADRENSLLFLQQNKIPLKDSHGNWLSYEDLSDENKKNLSSSIILHLSEHNLPEWKIQSLIGEVYTLEKEGAKTPLRDAKEFGTTMNACGRHLMSHIALEVCLGNRDPFGDYGKALALLEQHRNALRKGIQWVEENGVEERKSFYFFNSGKEIEDSLVGIIAGMLYGSVIREDKPIIAIAENEDDTVKISGRGTQHLIRKGLNLGKAFKEISFEMEGVEGGGHSIAAGLKVQKNILEEFLEVLEEKIALQINS
jgi:single-stranded-DNA-specific exonuclease